MKKILIVLIVSLAVVALLISCNNSSSKEPTYNIGDRGPAGGWIFYDCDADNSIGNADNLDSSSCGWRYLEVAKSDLGTYAWGNDGSCNTLEGIGKGKYNTQVLAGKGASYAASAVWGKTIDNYNDWYLPSIEELLIMYKNLHEKGVGNITPGVGYWSSSESSSNIAWGMNTYNDGTCSKDNFGREYSKYVRPIRQFK